jgi:transcriptional regulator with XRE-family HTH domain
VKPLTFTLALARVRIDRGITQAELARYAGFKPSAISHYETGRRAPSLANLIALADALGVSLDALVVRRKRRQT